MIVTDPSVATFNVPVVSPPRLNQKPAATPRDWPGGTGDYGDGALIITPPSVYWRMRSTIATVAIPASFPDSISIRRASLQDR